MKFGIGAKIVLLLIVLVMATASLLVANLWSGSSAIVIDHERGDLTDETRLRARELQTQLYAIRSKLQQLGSKQALQDYLTAGDEADPALIAEACRTFCENEFLLSYLRLEVWSLDRAQDQPPRPIELPESIQPARPVAGARQIVDQVAAARPPSVEPYLADIQNVAVTFKSADPPGEQTVHALWCGLRVLPAAGEAGADDSQRELFVVALMNLDDDLPNGSRSPLRSIFQSPRHLTVLANDPHFDVNGRPELSADRLAGRLVVLDETKRDHVDIEPLARRFAELYRQREAQTDLDTVVRSLLPKSGRSVLDDELMTLKKPLWFRQSESIADAARRQAVADELEQLKRELEAEGRFHRIGGLRGAVKNIRILANSEDELQQLSRRIEERLANPRQSDTAMSVSWDDSVPCEKCIVRYALLPVRSAMAPNSFRYYGIAHSAFEEEMQADVTSELVERLVTPARLVILGAALVGFAASFVFTRPLKRITQAAMAVGRTRIDPDPSNDRWRKEIDQIVTQLPVRRHDEIGVLARAFQQMIGEVVAGHQRLRQLNAELDGRVTERTRELEQANQELVAARDKAQELSRAKDAFLASVSHELRNPLNQVSGFCQLLELTELDEEQRADLAKIQLAGRQLLALINDILDYQKIVMGGLTLEPEEFSVADLLEEVGDAMAFSAAESQVDLRVAWEDDIGTLYADQQRVRQVLLNLAGNACKFAPEGVVSISARRVTASGGDEIVFEIADSGRGMTPDEQARLFTPFTKLGSKQGNRTGTGLGLVISKGFCELMNGGIELSSEFGKGSTFTVRLPAGTSAPDTAPAMAASTAPADNGDSAVLKAPETVRAASQAAPAPAVNDSPHGTILVIDDDAGARELMTRHLKSKGFDIVTAANGIEGLHLARQLQPAVITLDAVMPELDGWAVLAALKTDADTAEIPVVMVTMVDNQRRGQIMGASEFLVKPINWDRLTQVLARYTSGDLNRDILIVDDEAPARELIRRNLEQDGWTVHEAEQGAAALALLDELRPAAILLDLMMPVMGGLEFLAEFSRRPESQSIPVIVVTARDPQPRELQLLNEGGVRVLQKGQYTQDELLREIHRRVDRHLRASAASSGKGS